MHRLVFMLNHVNRDVIAEYLGDRRASTMSLALDKYPHLFIQADPYGLSLSVSRRPASMCHVYLRVMLVFVM